MSSQIQRRRGTTAQHASFTGAIGETTIDTDKEVVVVHDGTQVGGYPLMRENASNSALALGSAATPSLKFTGDTNTGIYSPGADQVAISTGGSGRLFVDASGNIAIGNSSFGTYSDRALSLYSTTNPSVKLSNATTGSTLADGIEIILSGSDGYLWNRENASWIFGTNNAERMRLTATGLGIGTSSPSSLLHVSGGDILLSNAYSLLARNNANTLSLALIRRDSSDNVVIDPDQYGTKIGGTTLVTTSAGLVGIGTTSVSGKLDVAGSVGTFSVATDGATVNFTRAGANYIQAAETGATLNYRSGEHIFTGTSLANERARIDTSGRLLVGTSTARSNFFNSTGTALIQAEGTSGGSSRGMVSIVNNSTSDDGPWLLLSKSGGASIGSNTLVSNTNTLGVLGFGGNDGSEFVTAAIIEAQVDGTPGANDMPGRLVFSTTADGASSPTERMRIDSSGQVLIGKTSGTITTVGKELYAGYGSHTASGNEAANFNRLASDGTVIGIYQDSNIEGTISVSGTTVSYNGAHLSRWSQLPSGADRTEILRGSVLSNIDEMCEWGDEENEQLNRMKMSDVEGDKNVSGVFQAWDDDDDTYVNDFYCAMTGDFIIRIGAGTTVERGDLLMSAGDGTAKPQDDDIIRSKTIAKVTSTNVSCTYDDGSYCVPCVLMAC